jgi:translation elongation factor Ts
VDATNQIAVTRPDQVRCEIDLLGDVDPAVRMRSAVELGRLRAVEAAPALVDQLGREREFFVRETLTWAILRITDAAMPFLEQALTSPRWLARGQAAHVLSKMGRHQDADLLGPLLRDEVDAVAARAYTAAGQTHNPAVLPDLVAALARGDSEHRSTLTAALAEFGRTAVPALVAALRDAPAPAVRVHAADTLAFLGSPDADRAALALAEAVTDPDGGVRVAALNALGRLRLPFAERTVDRVAGSAEPRLRHLAVRFARERLGPAPTGGSAGPAPTGPAGSTTTGSAGSTTTGIRRVRELTGAGVLRCRAALVAADGDPDRAVALLRSGPSTGTASENGGPRTGAVAAGPGVLVEVTCGSDLVARGSTFRTLVQRIADLAAVHREVDGTGLLDVPFDGNALGVPLDGGTLGDVLADLAAAAGERMPISRVVRLPGRTVSHLHPTGGGPVRIGALVSFTGGPGAEEIARRVARQVAVTAPRYLSRGDLPTEVLTAVRAEAEEWARTRGGTGALTPRLVAGRVERFVHDAVLLEQVSVVDPGSTIDGLLYGTGVHITGFARLAVGSDPSTVGSEPLGAGSDPR